MSELTYEQEYEIGIEVEFNTPPVRIEYTGCGTHHLTTSGKIELEEARRLHRFLGELPGIKDRPGTYVDRAMLHAALYNGETWALVNNEDALLGILCQRLGVTS